MKTTLAGLMLICSGLWCLVESQTGAAFQERENPGVATLVRVDGSRVRGRLSGETAGVFQFLAEGSDEPTQLASGMTLELDGSGPLKSTGMPPFRVDLGLGQQLSGQIVAVDAKEVRIQGEFGATPIVIARTGVRSVIQRPGETIVFEDDFERLDEGRWKITGQARLDSTLRMTGAHSLRIPSATSSLAHGLGQGIGSGRLEVAIHGDGGIASGQQWFLDLVFRGGTGSETVRIVLGWAEESLAVESPEGPALAVQRLKRKPGWHRLGVRFGPEGTSVSVDGDELAHGKGSDGPLIELRIASAGKGKPNEELAGHVDDLRLVRFDEPVGGLETDATQDEVRLTIGDQLFGRFRSADADRVQIQVDGSDVSLPWSQVSGLHLRRESGQGESLSGLLVRAQWRAAPGDDPRDLNQIEGVLAAVSDSGIRLETPYAGTLTIPIGRVKTLTVMGLGTRIMIDASAHHLGDEVSVLPPLLDPPRPEGGVLERAVTLESVPNGKAFLVLDVVQVVGESPEIPFSDLVKNNQLRTNVKLNGVPFDYVNHYIYTKNESPERVRLPIPKELLRTGKNVVRLELMGTKNNPNWLDDLGILGMAIEFSPEHPASNKPR
jgi:hypothetical protein